LRVKNYMICSFFLKTYQTEKKKDYKGGSQKSKPKTIRQNKEKRGHSGNGKGSGECHEQSSRVDSSLTNYGGFIWTFWVKWKRE